MSEANERPATVKELRAAFPNDAEFALECADQALTMSEAKIKFADAMLASGRSSPQPTGKTPGGKAIATSANRAAGAGGGDAGAETFEQCVTDEMAAHPNMSRKQAILSAARKNPEAHSRYVETMAHLYPLRVFQR